MGKDYGRRDINDAVAKMSATFMMRKPLRNLVKYLRANESVISIVGSGLAGTGILVLTDARLIRLSWKLQAQDFPLDAVSTLERSDYAITLIAKGTRIEFGNQDSDSGTGFAELLEAQIAKFSRQSSAPGSSTASTPARQPEQENTEADPVQSLAELKQMLVAELITKEEHDQKRAEILARM